jgi:hypothetical protein
MPDPQISADEWLRSLSAPSQRAQQPSPYGTGVPSVLSRPIRETSFGRKVASFGRDFLESHNVFREGISGRERAGRAFNIASWLLPPLKVGKTAALGIRAGVRALEGAAIASTGQAIRGEPILPAAGLAAGGTALIETLLTRGRRVRTAVAATRAKEGFDNPAAFANSATTPLHLRDYAIISAQRTDPSNIKLPDDVNLQRHTDMGKELRDLGYDPIDAEGFGAAQATGENVYVVPGMDEKSALELAKRYDQRYVITNRGIYDVDKATFSPLNRSATRFNELVDPASDFYTETAAGRFALEFGQPEQLSRNALERPTTSEGVLNELVARRTPNLIDRALGTPLSTRLHTWYVRTVRSFAEVEQLERLSMTRQAVEHVENSPAKLAEMANSAATYSDHAVEYGIVAWKDRTQRLTRGLKDIFKSVQSGEWELFENYGFAKRIAHLANDRGYKLPTTASGVQLTPEMLNEIITKVETQYPHLVEIHREAVEWHNTLLRETLGNSGVIDAATIEHIISTSPEYVPLRRAYEEAFEALRTDVDKLRLVANPLERIHALKGQFRPWTEEFLRDATSWSRIAHMQEFSSKLVQQFEQLDPSLLQRWAKPVPIGTPELTRMQAAALAELRQTDPALALAAEKLGIEIAALVAPHKLRASGLIGALVPTQMYRNRLTNELIPFDKWDAGVAKGKIVNADAFDLVDVPTRKWYQITDANLWETFAAMNPPQQNIFFRIAGAMASVLRAGATLSPSFLSRNPARDIVYAKTAGGASITHILGAFAEAFHKGPWYQQMLASGGGRANFISLDRDVIRKEMLTSLHGGSKVLNVIKHPVMALRALSDTLENGTRVGTFRQKYEELIRSGVDPAIATRDAAFAANNVTVNFNVHGSRTAAVRSLAAFWNAMIQGYDNLFRQFRNDPAGVSARAAAFITVPSVLLYFINRRDPEYAQLPAWERNIFWHVKLDDIIPGDSSLPWIGDKWLRFPKPFDLGIVFGSAVERLLEAIDADDPDAVDTLAGDHLTKVMSDLIPIPTAVKPLLEIGMNKSLLRNRPIVSRAFEDVAAEYQIQPGTSEVAQHLGNWLGLSPIAIDHMISGYTGGLGRLYADVADVVLNLDEAATYASDPTFDPRDIPGLSGLVSQFPRQNEPLDKLYTLSEKIREADATRLTLEKTFQFDDLADWMEQKALLLGVAPSVAEGIEQLKSLREQRDLILRAEGISPRDRNEMLENIADAMLAIATAYQPLIKEVENAQP